MIARRPSTSFGSAPLDPLRLKAARILLRWHGEKGYVRDVLEQFERDEDEAAVRLAEVERRRLRELVYGCVRLRGRYDFILKQLAKQSPKPPIRITLWLGLHEICELRTAHHAVVSQCVELARALGSAHAAGFVNGVLRRVAKEGCSHYFPAAQEDPIGYAASWLSHPRWLVERWAEALPPEEVLALCEANNRRPALVLRASHGRREKLLEAAREREWDVRPGQWAQDSVVLQTRVPAMRALRELGAGVTIQDEAAQLVPALLPGDFTGSILDLCAAPGGKMAQLADRFKTRATVVGLDLNFRRLLRVRDTFRRLELPPLFAVAADGSKPPFRPGAFDAVLVDAPCSGTGVLARRHEARWRRKPKDLSELPALQQKLLNSAVELCAPGGIIVYATCSLEFEENEAVVDAVLQLRADLVEAGAEGRVPAELLQNGRLRVWPHRHGCDGAFAAVLRRKEMKP
jgi:16S rRNA (cytosine967-C5)-methyltransferase